MDRKFPSNALIFHLEDGLYSLDFPNRIFDPKQASAPLPTSSYNSLLRLANLQTSIDFAIETQQTIMAQINTLLEEQSTVAPSAAEEEVALGRRYVTAQQRANKQAERRRDELRESLRSRREAMTKGRESQAETKKHMQADREKLEETRETLQQTEQAIRGQRRRICADLSDIFPITPIPNAPPLSFQICDTPLPNSLYDAATAKSLNEDVLSAGLGFVAMLTRHLQFYLSRPLPYPLFPYGSRSSVNDQISLLPDNQVPRREFPLFLPRGGSTVGQWRFEYGWFLLNKDIEALCSSQGLKVVDIRHSLPNLKYLLYVCSAGSDEVPERKKGGVRGLWVGRLKGRATLGEDGFDASGGSRRGSVDSAVLDHHSEALRDGVASKLSAKDSGAASAMPFDTTFTLRTKGLRENVSR